ncbi:MAG: GH92 family glycosyl hydrolase [Bacteroidaceae bacterium]|nr:GH92 family glycosyl hydrolase [Bacteroidaceae bacterium]
MNLFFRNLVLTTFFALSFSSIVFAAGASAPVPPRKGETAVPSKRAVDYVNPFIGTSGMGHTFPGACAPFGAVQLSPDTDTIPHNVQRHYQPEVYAYCAGYRYDDPTIVGFSHTHLSGTGHSDLGDLLLMPQTGELQLNPGTRDNPDGGYRQRFSHETEQARPGYYEVTLADNGVRAQLTATPRVGVHRYTFPQDAGEQRLILDLTHGIYNYDTKVLWSSLRVENDTLLTGFRMTQGWARCNYTYFAVTFSRPLTTYGYRDRRPEPYQGFWGKLNRYDDFPEMGGRSVVAYFNFDASVDEPLIVKVALSAVSAEGALKNLRAEAGDKSFETICNQTRDAWQRELSSIAIEGSEDQRTMFYTSLYHTMINPSVYSDVDGSYRGLDGAVHRAEDFQNYTVFSLWDTYRALHPLLTLLQPQRNTDMVRSMLAHQQQSAHHILPVWSLMGNEGWCMTGYHAVSVVADALVKGAKLDRTSVLAALRATATWDRFPGLAAYMQRGYAPFDNDGTAASNTLEYAYDDYAVAAAARLLGDSLMADDFEARSRYYRNTFDPRTGFATPRYSDGRFKQPMDPLQTYGEGFIEGNSWNFSFHVPHDVYGLMERMGGEEVFRQRLDALFSMDLPERYYADNEDITSDCLVGGYVHGNEPSHHIPYLYAWTSQPWRTQQWLRTILNRMYRNDIRGLGGNDDCGQMSAWFIFSALGFYPVCPGTDQYVLGAPYIPYADITLPGGRHLVVKAPKVSDRNRYVRRLLLNGKPYSRLYITHRQLTEGCVLEFEMTDKPNFKRGLRPEDKPFSLTGTEQNRWDAHLETIHFIDQAPQTEGSAIYHALIPNPDGYIRRVAREVMQCLYFAPSDSIPQLRRLRYVLKDDPGVSAKSGGNGRVEIFYSSRHVEKAFAQQDTARVDFETRGVLLHELTHAFQLEPQGIGAYGDNPVVWQLIEGMADAVRVASGGFHGDADRPRGGSYTKGYRYVGYFFDWLRRTKDADFLRKINRSCLEVVPWSWDAAMSYALGRKCTIDELWHEYQVAVGDIKE